ncbi:MAG: DUF4830 domain-containing protein [Ruminococcaceae bacterium]|nr:DUF4830 domain-containing protein [Oscillospiraceae bacterium]
MKYFLKENRIHILFMIFLGLMFILWGRMLYREFRLNTYTRNLTTTEARLSCLSYFGWEGDPGSEQKKVVVIPEPLDLVYRRYNQLQTPCGFNLERYCGKTVYCYTYQILNFPHQGEEPVYANLLIYEGALIGGDCMSTALDGFMLPLDRRFLK